MFLPMSWTSPFTVAMTTRPADRDAPGSFSASMNGTRWATAFFMTRALFTTWGRNILPEPNRSPTTFIPAISGPSMTSMGRAALSRASSVSSTMNASMPSTSAWVRRASTGRSRQASASPLAARSCAPTLSATASSRSVASGRRLSTTSSTISRSSGSMSS